MNNLPNPFRKTYRDLAEVDIDRMNAVKDSAEDLWNVLNELPGSREVSIAKTKLEEVVMWAVKGVTG